MLPSKSYQLDKSTTKNPASITPHKLYMPEVERSVSKAIIDMAFGGCGNSIKSQRKPITLLKKAVLLKNNTTVWNANSLD